MANSGIKNLKPFKKGDPRINRKGRPEGIVSVVQKLKKRFREDPSSFEEYLERYIKNPANERHIAEMLDGKPQQNTDITSNGDAIQPLLVKIIGENESASDGDTDGV